MNPEPGSPAEYFDGWCWRQLTQHSGWSFDEAETWLTASLTQLLLASSR